MKVKKHKVDYSGWENLTQGEKLERMLAGAKHHTSEIYIHKKVCMYLRAHHPEVRFYTTLDGFDWGNQRGIISSLRWYNEEYDGTGVPDLFIFKRNRRHTFLVLELKKPGAPKKTKHTDKQEVWLEYFRSMGAKAEFAVGYEDAVNIIKQYMRL